MSNPMNNPTTINLKNEHQGGTNFPRAILSVSREELDGVELIVKQGLSEEEVSLPQDLSGHLFVIAPVGTLDSPKTSDVDVVLPSADGWTPLFNGDGMVYRLDFDSGKAKLTNRLLKTPCYHADLATQQEKYQNLRFRNLGFGRVSLGDTGVLLGFRNQLNTAFVPLQFAGDAQRLLVTWDTGRPFEIEPRTLKLIAPVGWNCQWRPLIALPGDIPPFKQVVTSAHPCFDPNHGGELYTANVGKSLSTILWLSRSVFPKLKSILNFLKTLSNSFLFRLLEILFSLVIGLFQVGEKIFEWFSRDNFLYLLRWNGRDVGDLQQWKLVLDNGSPIKIQETLHQMGITEDYLVLADTSFKFDLEEVFPYSAISAVHDSEVLGLDLLDFTELPYTNIYIVPRADLKSDRQQVTVKKVRIPLAMAHYLVDYDNPDGKITLHTEHMCATDPSETLRSSDRSIFEAQDPQLTADLQQLAGTVAGAMDLSRLGCHVIDVASGQVESNYTSDPEYTWSTAFYAYREGMPTKKFEDIYWNSWGCWTDILSKHVYNLYQNYEQRTVPLAEVLELTRKGVPSSVCRLHIDRQDGSPQPELLDRYLFPQGYLGTSAQFIPQANSQGTTEGYLVCVVIHTDHLLSELKEVPRWSSNSEIWILDAANLAAGPLYRMSHPQLNFGFTLHTTWLASLGDSSSVRSYDVRQDYDWLLNRQSPAVREQMRELFEQEIYPHYESD
ncbi:carotenoid oxygenase family protein [Pleurocapsales cyanobacterium LEGE 10410]|nr:carotenoid oxygenase family protein [Pleurocapsales cyanobacterium LEGE 10410]